MLNDLHVALDRAEGSDVRVIVLTNTGTTFCAGADLRERLAGPVDSNPMVDAFRRLSDARQPTIAAVRGHVRAGGIGLMASCDLAVVPATTTFAFTEVLIGVAPAIISVPILRRCSAAAVASAFLTGETFDALHARSIGLVSHVSDDVEGDVAAMCLRLLAGAPAALAATKQILQNSAGHGDFVAMQSLSDELFQGEEAQEGMQAFFDKRPPKWAVAVE
ncbi:MAG: putative enoyl-CoA hydratase [Ilumatobacteraceae bacterium]|nr:putative enoyl-CoA hydratase [Ilumatobacteraceae bacterium]